MMLHAGYADGSTGCYSDACNRYWNGQIPLSFLNKWIHVAAVMTNDTTCTLYLNTQFVQDTIYMQGCQGENILLVANFASNRFIWSTGDQTEFITISKGGFYTVYGNFGCDSICTTFEVVIGDVCMSEPNVFIPNSFTPNGDLVNDYFTILCDAGQISFSVFNRWGENVYFNPNYQSDWDGTHKGHDLSRGAYSYGVDFLYRAEGCENTTQRCLKTFHGFLTLIR